MKAIAGMFVKYSTLPWKCQRKAEEEMDNFVF